MSLEVPAVNGADAPQAVTTATTAPTKAADATNTTASTLPKSDENSMQAVNIDPASEADGVDETKETGTKSNLDSTSQATLTLYTNRYKSLLEELDGLKETKRSFAEQLRSTDDISSVLTSYRSLRSQRQTIYSNMQTLISQISAQLMMADTSSALKEELQKIAGNAQDLASNLGEVNLPDIDENTPLGTAIVGFAQSFVGKINSDAEGNKEFTPGGVDQPWCADFVTSIVKRAYQATGQTLPAGFGSSSVAGHQQWGEQNKRFLKTTGQANKAQLIGQNVKPGDIAVFNQNGTQHVAIVVSVDAATGKFTTVGGNESNAVKQNTHSPDENILTGFIRMV